MTVLHQDALPERRLSSFFYLFAGECGDMISVLDPGNGGMGES